MTVFLVIIFLIAIPNSKEYDGTKLDIPLEIGYSKLENGEYNLISVKFNKA